MSRSASLGVLLDHAQDKIVLLDEEGRFTYLNRAVERTLGWDPETLVGDSAFEYVHPDDVDAVRTTFEHTIDSDEFEQTTVEHRYRASDGSWVWLESRMSNCTDDELDGYVVSSRDVSDRVEAQRERQEMADHLTELTTTAGDVLWLFDGDWSEVLFVNPAYEDVYGKPIEELEAEPQSFLDAVHPQDVPAVQDAMERLATGESVDVEYRVNPERDYGVWVWVQAEPILEDGEVVRIAGFSRDVTDRRRRERQLMVMDNLLRHNLRNDLSAVLGNAELIEQEAPDVADRTAVIRETGEQLLESAEKERDIIDLLTRDPGRNRVDLVAAVETAAERVRERFPDARIETETPETAAGDTLEEIGLAVVELLENALIHSEHDRPSTSVTVEPTDDRVVLTIEDDAPPIPDIEARVLTGDHEMDDVYHSSGLGLWLVYWIVELSGGTIDVAPHAGEGNRVRLAVPRNGE